MGHKPSDTTLKVLVSIGGVLWPLRLLLLLLRRRSFLMCRGRRTARPGSRLPTHCRPGGFDQINDRIDGLPDPDLLCAEERAAAMRHTARLRNRIEAYLTGLAGAADAAGDSRVLGAGTSGSLVAIATGSPVAVGSGMVNTANALHDLPVVKDAWAAGVFRGCMCIRSWPRPGHR